MGDRPQVTLGHSRGRSRLTFRNSSIELGADFGAGLVGERRGVETALDRHFP